MGAFWCIPFSIKSPWVAVWKETKMATEGCSPANYSCRYNEVSKLLSQYFNRAYMIFNNGQGVTVRPRQRTAPLYPTPHTIELTILKGDHLNFFICFAYYDLERVPKNLNILRSIDRFRRLLSREGLLETDMWRFGFFVLEKLLRDDDLEGLLTFIKDACERRRKK